MNRLVLIGNGFDLAHGLKTSYSQFIEDFWYNEYFNIIKQRGTLYDGKFLNITYVPNLTIMTEETGNYLNLKHYLKNDKSILTFKNKLLQHISNLQSEQKWADLERIFYKLLTGFLRSERGIRRNAIPYISIDELNREFDEIKTLFIQYLQKIPVDQQLSHVDILKHIYGGFKLHDFGESLRRDILEQKQNLIQNLFVELTDKAKDYVDFSSDERSLIEACYNNHSREDILKFLLSDQACGYKNIDLTPNQIMLLNFNYTNTANRYTQYQSDIKSVEINYIHGDLQNMDTNPIIFGFGDELDENYHQLEELDDNKYLENIKSIAYLRTSNYKRLLEFIESDNFQVSIMGHSCGLSDRTMLNSIFEHENCQSVKVYYHLREDGSDNYNDIIRNISRHFKDKAKMRDRVVNKTYCEPLLSNSQ